MHERKEDARPAVGAAERAKESKIELMDSNTYYNAIKGKKQLLCRVLPLGKDHAITGRDLVSAMGLKDLRELTQIIERERRAGAPICASVAGERGYYMARSAEELAAYIKSLDRRLRAVRLTRRHLEDTLERMTGQVSIE